MNFPFFPQEIVQYLAVLFCSMGIITCGLQYGWAAASLPHLQDVNDTNKNVHLSASEGSWAAIGILLGSLVGSPLTGMIVDILGRKTMILISNFPYIISWVTIAYANSSILLVFGRFMAGLSDGICFTTVPIYIGEISSPQVRGLLGSSVPICLITGVLIINVMELFLSVTNSALMCIIFPLISFLGMLLMPESPYYLIMRNKKQEALNSLKRFRGTDAVNEEMSRIDKAIKAQTDESNGTLKDIFKVPSNRRAMLIMLLLRITQQLSGITALIFYISIIYKQAGTGFSVQIFTIIFFAVQSVMSLVGSAVVDWTGRRVLILWSLVGSALSLFIEGVYLHLLQDNVNMPKWSFVPTTALGMFVVFYGFGLQNVPLLMVGELFPTNIKATAACLSDVYFSILASIVSKYFQYVNTNIGAYLAFYTFGVCCIINFSLVYLFVPETKGLTLEEIQMLLQSGKKFKQQLKDIEVG
ncbi:hypothetical protein WA026_000971 [Henosepilachna vigintioctopunctata]|uniref:Major facilitator superfamily (MFS) profile domain-containing protein n=1 Tax=Henosepilachna vigintioctopunctata TaxID=420089 RepID=A0AAW1V6N3_9CUCU